jgi:inorganic phosphate transporter, PiT family
LQRVIAKFIFLSSGLFMGWSLGANDAANIFGTAVGTKMVRFTTAAIISSVFIVLGAVLSGYGTTDTLGALGEIKALPGAFIVALASAATIMWMTKTGLPVSTSQAIVGAILGWNIFSGMATDCSVLYRIVGAWLFTPVLAAIFSVMLYFLFKYILENVKIHMFRLDWIIKLCLLLAGAFGSFSLGMNNIANVVGVFTASSPFFDIKIGDLFVFSAAQQLLFLGGISIALGVITFSKKVMMTVGSSIYKLSPVTALIVVLSSSLVLFLFASEGLRMWLLSSGLPAFPLVPVSQSQGVVGAIFGIGLAKGGGNVNTELLGKIFVGWLLTPLSAGILCLVSLYIMQNVFMQNVIF